MNLERVQSSDIVATSLPHKRLQQLRTLLTAAKTLILRSPSSSPPTLSPDFPNLFDGLDLQVAPIEPPTEAPEPLLEPIITHRRTKPASSPLPNRQDRSCPTSAYELMDLRGIPEDVAIAQRIRERFWTHVVRSLAKESSFGAAPREIQVIRRYYIRSANSKPNARWWISNEDKLT
jgi:hypothetical protein